MALAAGRLNRRVAIQAPHRVHDDGGGSATSWSTVDTVWAAIESPAGFESFGQGQVNARVTHKVRVRARTVSPQHRLLYGSRILAIRAVLPDAIGEAVDLLCEEIELPTLPDAPTASAATDVDHDSFTANWSTTGLAESYRLDVSTEDDFGSFVSGYEDVRVADTSQSVTGVGLGTYYYRVRGHNASGPGASSDTIAVQPFWLYTPAGGTASLGASFSRSTTATYNDEN